MQLRRKAFLQITVGALGAQDLPHPGKPEEPKRMPDGTLQSEAILKDEFKKMLSDVERIQALTQQIEEELNKNQHNVLSLGMVKKLEEIEKLAKRMRTRVMR